MAEHAAAIADAAHHGAYRYCEHGGDLFVCVALGIKHDALDGYGSRGALADGLHDISYGQFLIGEIWRGKGVVLIHRGKRQTLAAVVLRNESVLHNGQRPWAETLARVELVFASYYLLDGLGGEIFGVAGI